MSATNDQEQEQQDSQTDNANPENQAAPHIPSGTTIDELTDRLRHAGGVSDDWANTIAENWKRVLGAGVILILGVWFINEFRGAEVQKQGDASDKFASLQEVYLTTLNPILGDKPEDKEHAERMVQALESNVQLIEKGYSSSVYAKLAELYAASAHLEKGDVEKARAALKKFNLANYEGKTSPVATTPLEPEDMIEELAALINLRSYLDDAKADNTNLRARVKSLAYSSRLVTVDALLILAHLSESSAERTEVVDVANSISDVRPEMRNLITREISPLGYDFAPTAKLVESGKVEETETVIVGDGEVAEK